MDEHFSGDIQFIKGNAMMFVNAVICKSKKQCQSTELLVDTGSTRSMLSYELGNLIGFDAPKHNEKIFRAQDAQRKQIKYVLRKVKLYLGQNINKEMMIPWCVTTTVKDSFLGMDFFNRYKLIVVGGKTNKFYITKIKNCVFCAKEK